jgi:hypothetical protein
MITRVQRTVADYPREFWILFGGTLVNSAGSALIFPFLTLYMRQRFDIPMTTISVAFCTKSLSNASHQSPNRPQCWAISDSRLSRLQCWGRC